MSNVVDTIKNCNDKNSEEVAVYGANSKYLTQYQNILDDFKKIHILLQRANGPETYFIITKAQKRLTQSAKYECDRLLKELLLDFTDNKINDFTEKVISLITSIETTNQLYGGIVDVVDAKKYISHKITKIADKRYKILSEELGKNSYIEEGKTKIIYQNILFCKKILSFANEIYRENVLALKYNIRILQNLIDLGDRLGLDSYTKELYAMDIKQYSNVIFEITDSSRFITEKHAGKLKFNKEIINKTAIEQSSNMLVTLNSKKVNIEEQNKVLTRQFMNTAQDVIKNTRRSSTGDFVANVMQQFSSILSTIDTLNYLMGNVIDYKVVAKNISEQLSNLVYTNYTTMTTSWNSIQNKNQDDYNIYLKEIFSYKDNLIKAYELDQENVQALERYIEIVTKILEDKSKFKISSIAEGQFRKEINEYSSLIKDFKTDYNLESTKTKKEKKSFFSKFWS